VPRAPRDGRTNCPPNTAVLVGILLSWLYNIFTDFARALLTTVKVANSVAGSLACNFAVAFVNPPSVCPNRGLNENRASMDVYQIGTMGLRHSFALLITSKESDKIDPGTCVQYPGLQGGGALGDASTPGTPADSIATSAHGGTYSHVAVAGGAWGRERGTAAATARRRPAGVARRPRARPSLRRAAHLRTAVRAADTAHGRAGGTDRRATRRR